MHRKTSSVALGFAGVALGLAALTANAQERPAPPGQPQPQVQPQPQQQPQFGPQAGGFPVPNLPPAELLPTVPLEPLLASVGRSASKKFLIDARSTQQIYLGGAEPNAVDYPTLLAILRNNGLAAIEIEGFMNVMPLTDVRFHAPIVQSDDTAVADDEWVTRVIVLTTVEAPFLVPILRPMLPQAAHFAALPPNKLIVMDRYANVRRITEIVRALDQ